MILFFSGTGNSKHIATLLAAELSDELLDVSVYTRQKVGATLNSDKPFVLVAPAYCSYIPLVVEKFLLDSTFSGNKDFYLVMTFGGSFSAAGVNMKIGKFIKSKGLRYMGLKCLRMPENFITMFAAPTPKLAEKIIVRADKKVPAVAEKIGKGKSFFKCKFPSVFTYWENPLFYKRFVIDEPYTVTEACVSCGKCATLCPLANIELKEGKPCWKGNCTQCMACIGGCPKNAIEYGKKTQKKRRYYLEK